MAELLATELKGFSGIEELFLYDMQEKTFTFKDVHRIDEKTLRDFVSVYITKQQCNLDVIADFITYRGSSENFVLSRKKQMILGFFLGKMCDLRLVRDKVKEIWTRIEIGV